MKTRVKKPKMFAFSYLFLLVGVFLASLYFGEYILWLSFMFLASILMVDLVFFIFAIKNIKVLQKYSSNIVERSNDLKIKVKVKTKPLLLINNSFRYYLKNELNEILQVDINNPEKSFTVKPNEVGVHYFGLDCLLVKSFFGILSKKYNIDSKYKNKCTVTPKQRYIDISTLINTNNEGFDFNFGTKREKDDFVGIRPYVFGDSLKSINFKKSSVLRKTIVNEFESTISNNLANIFIEPCDKKDYTAVSEAVLAIYDYYLKIKINSINVNYFDGMVKTYTMDSKYQCAIDLAKFELDNNITNFEYKENINAIILSQYSENASFQFINSLSDDSIIYLHGEAVKFKLQIENLLRSTNLNHIYVLSENNLSDEEKGW